MLDYEGFDIYWDGHATVRIVDEGFTVLVDPFGKVSQSPEADLVMVTHRDAGHFDTEELESVCGDSSCVVVPESFSEEEVPCEDVELISEGEIIDVFGIEIEAVPMYGESHERGDGFGFRFSMRKVSFYAAGDTGLTDEMFELEGSVDVAFLPVEGVYTMDVEEAVKSAVRIKPDVAVPYHYGEPFFPDADPDLRGMKAELEDRSIECRILEPESFS